jgi:hypothetical protein
MTYTVKEWDLNSTSKNRLYWIVVDEGLLECNSKLVTWKLVYMLCKNVFPNTQNWKENSPFYRGHQIRSFLYLKLEQDPAPETQYYIES